MSKLTDAFNATGISFDDDTPKPDVKNGPGVWAVDMDEDKPSDNEMARQRDERNAHNAGMKEGGAESIGQQARTNATSKVGQSKKEKEKQRQLRAAADFQAQLTTLNGMMGDFWENQRIIDEGIDLLKSRDLDGAKEWLQDEFGLDTEGMTEQEIWDSVKEQLNITIASQEELVQQINDLARQMEESGVPEELQDKMWQNLMDEVNSINHQHGLNLNYTLAQEDVFGNQVNNSALNRKALPEYYSELETATIQPKTDPFEVSNNTSFSSRIESDDPFAQKAGELSKEFAQVADGNDSEVVEHKQDRNHENSVKQPDTIPPNPGSGMV